MAAINGNDFGHNCNGSQSIELSASPEDKFNAAVRVIQSLPKNGSFQPSHAMMLRFYALYKQAKFGPCHEARPAFWDVVGRAKWDAWKQLGGLSRTEAMLSYVDELKNVIETMPHTPDVSLFLEKLGSFYELVDDISLDNEHVVACRTEASRKESTPSSSASHSELRSSLRLAQRIQQHSSNSVSLSESDNTQKGKMISSSSSSTSNSIGKSYIASLSSDSEEEFMDSIDQVDAVKSLEEETTSSIRTCDAASLIANRACSKYVSTPTKLSHLTLCPELADALARINSDLKTISQRLDRIEGLYEAKYATTAAATAPRSWTSLLKRQCFTVTQPRTLLFLIAWPLFVNLLLKLLQRRHRQQ